MAYALTWDEAAKRIGSEQRLKLVFAGETSDAHPKFDAAVAAASGHVDDALRTAYNVPLDEPLPEPLASHAYALVFHYGSLSSANSRAENVDKAKDAAEAYLGELAGGKKRLIDPEDATAAGTPVGEVWTSERDFVFDFDNPDSEGSSRLPKL